MCWSKFNLLSNLTPRYFVESNVFIGMSFIKIFGNAGSILYYFSKTYLMFCTVNHDIFFYMNYVVLVFKFR